MSADLQIDENSRFQNGFWAVQRLAWFLFGMLLVGAVLGLTGNGGVYSHRTADFDDFSVNFPAVARRRADNMVQITLSSAMNEATLHFDSAFLQAFSVQTMTPQPVASVATSTGVTYRVKLEGPGPKTLRISVSPEDAGRAIYTISVDGQAAQLASLILP
jgi:hypothetical protein